MKTAMQVLNYAIGISGLLLMVSNCYIFQAYEKAHPYPDNRWRKTAEFLFLFALGGFFFLMALKNLIVIDVNVAIKVITE